MKYKTCAFKVCHLLYPPPKNSIEVVNYCKLNYTFGEP